MNNDYKTLKATGKVYIKDFNDNIQLSTGDMRIYMNIDKNLLSEDKYHSIGVSGYFKGEIYDGKFWKLIDMEEFFDDREYKFSKQEMPIDTANLCVDILSNKSSEINLYRTYRGHYTIDEYVREERETKWTKKKNKKK